VNFGILADVAHPLFASEVEKVTAKSANKFFRVVSTLLREGTPPKILNLLFMKCADLVQDPELADSFCRFDIHRLLPYSLADVADAICALLKQLFAKVPTFFQTGFESNFMVVLNRKPKEAMGLLRAYAGSFESLENPWPLLDIVITRKRTLLKLGVALETVKLIQKLLDIDAYRAGRLFECLDLISSFLTSDDMAVVKSAYRTLTLFYHSDFALDFSAIQHDLLDRDLSPSVISLLMKIPEIPVVREIVAPIAKLARDLPAASRLLFILLDQRETGKLLMEESSFWRHGIPSFRDTLEALIKMLKFKTLKAALADFPAVPILFALAIDEGADGVFACFQSVLQKGRFTDGFLHALEESDFFLPFFEGVVGNGSSSVVTSGLMTLGLLAQIGYVDSFRPFAKCLGRFIKREGEIARAALFASHALSFHRRMTKYLSAVGIRASAKVFLGTSDEELAHELIKNLPHVT
jgi:hypothetical protein